MDSAFPRTNGSPSPIESPRPDQSTAAPGDPTGRAPSRPVVLVVDDEEAVRRVLHLGLTRCGFDVLSAAGGREALAVYRERGPSIDLVLLDVRMPGMDGGETLTALRAIDPAVRAFFMTGDPGSYTPERLLALGAGRVFGKPVLAREIATEFWKVLPDRAGAGPVARDETRAGHLRSLIDHTGQAVRSALAGGDLLARMESALERVARDGGYFPGMGRLIRDIRRARAEAASEPPPTGARGPERPAPPTRASRDAQADELLGDIAHDFRTALATIRLTLSALRAGNPDHLDLTLLERQLDILARLADDLTAGSRVTSRET